MQVFKETEEILILLSPLLSYSISVSYCMLPIQTFIIAAYSSQKKSQFAEQTHKQQMLVALRFVSADSYSFPISCRALQGSYVCLC